MLEHPPSETHEPNGAAERAGQEIIDKANAMLLGARLPTNLWPEATKAAAYLYNMSPKSSNAMTSPNEKMLEWLKDDLNTNNPAVLRGHACDLRPDWSGIYAYGCRAYALEKERRIERQGERETGIRLTREHTLGILLDTWHPTYTESGYPSFSESSPQGMLPSTKIDITTLITKISNL